MWNKDRWKEIIVYSDKQIQMMDNRTRPCPFPQMKDPWGDPEESKRVLRDMTNEELWDLKDRIEYLEGIKDDK